MVTTYRYGQAGVAAALQHGRRGGFITWDGGNTVFQAHGADGSTLVNFRVATTPVDANDAASKSYVDGLVQGLSAKDSVRAATTAAGTLATDFENGDTIDGVTLATNDRILIKDQAAPAENGIYTVNATGAPTRALDADSNTDLGSAFVFVEEGAVHLNQGWVTTFDSSDTVDTDPVNWVQFSTAGTITASDGVLLSGADIQLDVTNLSNVATVGGDELVFADASAAGIHIKRSITDFIADHNLTAQGTLTGGIGIDITGTTVTLDRSGMADTAVVGTDTVPFFDASNGDEPEFRSWNDIFSDLAIPAGTVTVTAGGTGLSTIAANSLLVANTADTLTALTATDTAGDQLVQWNDTTNAFEFITTASIGGLSFGTIGLGGNTTGDASVIAATAADTLNLAGGAGITLAGVDATDTITAALTLSGLTATTVTTADSIAFFDNSASDAPVSTTVANFLNDLTIVSGVAGTGITVQTAVNTYASRTITAAAAGATAGIAVTNGDGVAGDPTIGVDINNLAARSDGTTDNTNDFVMVYNASATANEKFTIGELLANVAVDSFATITGGGNTTGDASIVADAAGGGDAIVLTGGDGINVDLTAASDTVTLSLSRAGLADTAVVGGDTVPFFDASAANATEFRSWTDIMADLDIVNNITADGMIVRTAADTYASRTITASAVAGDEGISVVDGDGVAGNPTVGLDITGLTVDATLVGTDEFAYYNGTNNRKVALTDLAEAAFEIANGVRVIEATGALATAAIAITLPANGRILRARVDVGAAYDNAADISIVGATAGEIIGAAEIDAQQVGTYVEDVSYRNTTGAAETFTFTLSAVPTVGASSVFIEYYAGAGL